MSTLIASDGIVHTSEDEIKIPFCVLKGTIKQLSTSINQQILLLVLNMNRF